MSRLHRALRSGVALASVVGLLASEQASAFCGFYVAQADTKLFNSASKVVLAHDGDTTSITMASDYQGDAKEFAVVVPVPTFIERSQIDLVNSKTIDHIDAYSAPRLVEYHDPDPCAPPLALSLDASMPVPAPHTVQRGGGTVKVEANYDVGEYDVSILSASESDGLTTWLEENGYKIPPGAGAVLGSYIKQNMHFFVAKVNLARMKLIGAGYLRPMRVTYHSPKFMIPLRLGTLNARGPQDLIVFALTRRGRVEAVNYPNIKMRGDVDVPMFVKDDFGSFYKATFERAAERQDRRAVFVEYAWSLGNCDPCSSQPMSGPELKELGASWSDGGSGYVTRLHVRYDAQSFPEDIALEETADASSFQARYVLRHPWRGEEQCPAAEAYRAKLPDAFAEQADNLIALTGWPRADVEARMAVGGQPLTRK